MEAVRREDKEGEIGRKQRMSNERKRSRNAICRERTEIVLSRKSVTYCIHFPLFLHADKGIWRENLNLHGR